MTSAEFQNFAELFREAERRVKEIEHLTDSLAIPAINELRYAGFHAVQAIVTDSPEGRREQIKMGERHCKRAIFDVIELGIAYHVEGIRLFQHEYRLVSIAGVVPDYLNYVSEVRAAQEFLGNNSLHEPAVEWEAASRHYQSLKDIYERLEDARPELNKQVRMWRNSVIALLISSTALLVAIAGLILRMLLSR